MGGCCGGASDVSEDAPQDAPPRGRVSGQSREHASTKEAKATCAAAREHVFKKQRRLSFNTPGRGEETSSCTNGGTQTCATTTAATSYPGCTPATSVVVMPETPLPHDPHMAPLATTSLSLLARSQGLPYSASRQTQESAEALLSDVFRISESSRSSSSSAVAGQDVLSTSLVEVSQATQSFRQHDRTHSEMDATSELGETSMDRTFKRRSHSRHVDRLRVQHLATSEAEVRASLTLMYSLQHRRALLRCVKEQFIEQRVMMLRAHQDERTASCVGWLVARERAAREGIAREWWTERALLARHARLSPTTTTSTTTMATSTTAYADPLTDMSESAKRDDSLMHITSHTGREEELSSSDATVEEDAAMARSPSLRLAPFNVASRAASPSSPPAQKAFSAPCASRLALSDATPARASSSSLSQPQSRGAVRKLSTAQQAFRDRMARGRRQGVDPIDSA